MSGHRSSRPSRRASPSARDYPRTARLNELLREILGEAVERLDDDRLVLLTITSVSVEADLRRATVFFDTLDGAAGDEDALAALAEARVRLQAAIGRQARIKRVPELVFAPDPAVRSGERIDEVLRDIGPLDHDRADERDGADDDDDA